jgi:two-component system, NarL family, response regulator NreC
MAIRVLVADDHKIIRDGLRSLIERSPELELVGEAADGQEAVDRADELLPDVVLLDITMPVLDGSAAARLILERHPQMKVLTLSMHTDRYFVDKMRAAGAHGYVPKDEAYDILVEAILAIQAGGTFFPGER